MNDAIKQIVINAVSAIFSSVGTEIGLRGVRRVIRDPEKDREHLLKVRQMNLNEAKHGHYVSNEQAKRDIERGRLIDRQASRKRRLK